MSLAHRGSNNHMYGKSPSKESREKMSNSHKGHNHWNYGKSHSKEIREKMSNSHKGLRLSIKTREKISKSLVGKNNPNSKKVKINGIVYDTIKEAAEKNNVHRMTISRWIKIDKAKLI